MSKAGATPDQVALLHQLLHNQESSTGALQATVRLQVMHSQNQVQHITSHIDRVQHIIEVQAQERHHVQVVLLRQALATTGVAHQRQVVVEAAEVTTVAAAAEAAVVLPQVAQAAVVHLEEVADVHRVVVHHPQVAVNC